MGTALKAICYGLPLFLLPVGCVRSGFHELSEFHDATPAGTGAEDAASTDRGAADGRVEDAAGAGGDAGRSDATGRDGGDASTTVIGDEHIELTPGWSVELYRDFSAEFELPGEPFIDQGVEMEEYPQYLFLLEPTFPEGLGVASGRRLHVLDLDGGYTLHDYTPAAPNTSGPDGIDGIGATADWEGAPSIFFVAGTMSGGDGAFQVTQDWAITRISSRNNLHGIVVDSDGRFDALGAPTLYFGANSGLLRDDLTSITSSGQILDCALLPSDDLACAWSRTDDWTNLDVIFIESVTHTQELVVQQPNVRVRFVEGALERLEGDAYFIVDFRELRRVDRGGAVSTIARGLNYDQGFRWEDGVVPPVTHGLGADAAIYLLEHNHDRGVYRILRFSP